MKFYGEKSVSSFMYKMSKVGYWLSIILSVVFLFILGAWLLDKSTRIIDTKITSGMFTIKYPEKVKNLHTITIFGLMCPVLVIMSNFSAKLFDNFRKNIIFDKKNLKFIKYLAYFELLGGIMADLMDYFDYKLAIVNIHIPEVSINYGIAENTIDALLVAITYYMIAIALEKAIEYKEENELTV